MFLSLDSVSSDYLSPMRTNTVTNRKVSRESQRGTSTKEKYGIPTSQTTLPPRVEIAKLEPLPPIPLTPSTADSSSFFDPTELFDAFPKVPQNLPNAPGTSLLSGFELRTKSELGIRGGLGKGSTVPSSYRPHTSGPYR